jgi:uracil-DNA glycosylase
VGKVAEPGAPASESRRERLVELYKEASTCTLCPLAETRTKVVFGAGHADADLMFIGEAPGAEEDRQGLPFVGRAGSILTGLLEEIGLRREDTFICNVLKCRPPGNRDPLPEEIEECSPWLFRQIELIEPLVVCTLGNFSTKLLTGSKAGITKVHGRPQTHELGGRSVQLYPIFHPAAALRTDSVRDLLRADFARLPGLLEEARQRSRRDAAEDAAAAPELGPGLPKSEASAMGSASSAEASASERSQLDLFE